MVVETKIWVGTNLDVDLKVSGFHVSSRGIKEKIIREVRSNLFFREPIIITFIRRVDESGLVTGSIMDCETTGLDPEENHIITLGILKDNQIRVLQLCKPYYRDFQGICHRVAERQPKPYYAYASHFEQGFLKIQDGWQDLMQYYEVDYDLENPFRRYRLNKCTTHPFRGEPYDIDSPEIVPSWENWLKTRNPNYLTEIIYHNICDLLREYQLIQKRNNH